MAVERTIIMNENQHIAHEILINLCIGIFIDAKLID